MIPSLGGWATKAEEAPSPHEVRLAVLDTNPVFQNLGEIFLIFSIFPIDILLTKRINTFWPEQLNKIHKDF